MYVSLSWILEMYLSTTHSDTASRHARAHTYDSNEHTMRIDHAHVAQSSSRVEDASSSRSKSVKVLNKDL